TDAADIQDENEAADDNEASEADASRVKIRQEAKLIAQRIHTLVGHMPVRDANAPTGTRPCRHSDIVVLTRSVRSIAATLTEELKLQGINAAAETSGGFFETPEIMIALSLLRVVDNPRQDIDLLALLRLYNFTPDEMLAIRFQSEDTDYYDCLLAYMDSGENTDLRNRINALLEDINRWRKRAIVLPISRLVGVLYEETRLPYRFGAMPGGTVRQANLQLLLEKAIQYEATSFTGLFHFVQYIEWLKTHAEDESAAMILPEDDTIVRVMTIHKSKGLEFPVVFVTMLGRQLNRMDERTGVILHPALGLGAMYTDLALRTRSNTISRLALSLLRQREMVSEELRVLYVAMTRAKEKLILTGCVTDLDGKLEKWQALSDSCGGSLPLYALREGKSYLDWLMPCALQSQEDVILHIHREMATEYTTPISLTELAPQMLAPSPNIIQYQAEPYKTESTLPSKLAISELKRIYALETSPDSATVFEDESIFEAPAFYKEATGQITPMHMGTILHTVVEHMDIHNDRDTAAITALIAALVDRGLLSQEEEDAVDISKIEGFATSQLADRMRNARYLYREIPFVIGIPPQAVYADMNIDDSATDDILVHGIIDCYFETQEGDIVLVDFKSDARPETLHQRYATQMKIYRKAIEQATGKPVSESLFYSFS
ncbi:MAG: PD-(D/E)XK nuclease family protein, partial [Defluviitaleaceae bacterium]|nr:PD-(D/E)XK nuclease family protein [Defluviitaleaceae bacterium]